MTANPSGVSDPGRSFEERCLHLARAIHDPSGVQGAEMVDGRERDGIFIDGNSVFVYEFTTLGTKEKAKKDGGKIAELLNKYRLDPKHRFKAFQGRFVTQSEPTAEQRREIERISREKSVNVVAMSAVSLRKQMIDSEDYLALRLQAPFGSAGKSMADVTQGAGQRSYVDPTFKNFLTGREFGISEVGDSLKSGEKLLIVGDFGVGKSAALAQLFVRLRKNFFKNPVEARFPLHINVRDLRGLFKVRGEGERRVAGVERPVVLL